MNWDDLRFVLALARSRTLSGAAATLMTTHTTVARRIRALEERVGSRLFSVDDGGYTPTAAGAHVVRSAERTEAEMHELEARLLGGDAKLEGKLRVTTMDILFRRYEPAFTSFLERFPGVELTLSCNDADASLTRREADVALRMTGAPPPNLVGRKIGRVELAVYASRHLARRVGAKAPLSKWPWLSWDERLGPSWLEPWLAKHAPEARVALWVDMTSLPLREVVASGIGVHFLARTEGDSDPRLVRISPVATELSRDVWLLTLDELRAATRVRAFLDHFVERTAK
ncbi:MAG: LysR family transcriptional regulator [Labilithrix sp.]|nr:LysR family transcriptional regulator [Labilithrix sp.]MCW5812678.1 LysR family transcriptional regulator [Labilithrix sp.]